MINNSVLDESLGVVNGLGQSLASLARMAGPGLGGILWSVSMQVAVCPDTVKSLIENYSDVSHNRCYVMSLCHSMIEHCTALPSRLYSRPTLQKSFHFLLVDKVRMDQLHSSIRFLCCVPHNE